MKRSELYKLGETICYNGIMDVETEMLNFIDCVTKYAKYKPDGIISEDCELECVRDNYRNLITYTFKIGGAVSTTYKAHYLSHTTNPMFAYLLSLFKGTKQHKAVSLYVRDMKRYG